MNIKDKAAAHLVVEGKQGKLNDVVLFGRQSCRFDVNDQRPSNRRTARIVKPVGKSQPPQESPLVPASQAAVADDIGLLKLKVARLSSSIGFRLRSH